MRSSPSRPSAAGGALIAFGVIGGAVIGALLRQPTEGFLIGGGGGIAAAILVWLIDRRR